MENQSAFSGFRSYLSGLVVLGIGGLLLLSFVGTFEDSNSVYAAQPNLSPHQTLPTVQFEFSNTAVDEENANHEETFNVRLSSALSGSNVVSVSYQTIDGTARAGVDYIAASGTITFSASSGIEESISVTIIGDSVAESDETFSIVLQVPVSATLGTNDVTQITITNDDATPTSTPSSGGTSTPIFVDQYEGNDTLQTAFDLDPASSTDCTNRNDATFWPAGDIDFYRFWARGNIEYVVTSEVGAGIDTIMTLYTPEGEEWLRNDNNGPGVRTSEIRFTPDRDAYYYVSLINEDPSDPAGKTYCVKFQEIAPTATPSPTATPPVNAAETQCEPNNSFNEACVQSVDVPFTADFVPERAGSTDVDYYRYWARANYFYSCETTDLSEFNDTKISLFDANFAKIGDNDNKDTDEFGSKFDYFATYTGWLYVLVEPAVAVEYSISNLYDYTITCSGDFSTPTSTPFPTRPPGAVNPVAATATPTASPTLDPEVVSPTPTIDIEATIQAALPPTAVPTQPPVVGVRPLPTNTPEVVEEFLSNTDVILFYDKNQNNLPEIDEGIRDMAIYVYDGVTGQLMTLGYTNEAGMITFQVSNLFNSVRLEIPYLGISQVVSGSTSEVLIRVAPNVGS